MVTEKQVSAGHVACKNTQVVVLGGGPGGYSAAFRAADLGLQVILVERYNTLGGVCLNVGCIPSKALLHVAEVMEQPASVAAIGITMPAAEYNLTEVRAFKDKVVSKLVNGVGAMAKTRKVDVVTGFGKFVGSHTMQVKGDNTVTEITFEHAIIAVGSANIKLPFLPVHPRIWDSTIALNLSAVPKRLLVNGGGIIGLEMATVYQALGSEITIAEFSDQLIPAADKGLVFVYSRYNSKRFDILLNTKVESVNASSEALHVGFTAANGDKKTLDFDAILVAVGRQPNGGKIGAAAAGVQVDERGFIAVNTKLQTNVENIYAIGDVVGQPMLAHKASHEGKVAAENIAGHNVQFTPLAIPSIAYTNPEIAWVGLTEKAAKEQGIEYKTAVYPWSASGRALGAHRSEGKTKLIYNPVSDRLLGAGIVGANAGELLGELTLAIEFGASVEDIAMTIHAHPTLHETVGLAAELATGTITDLPNLSAKIKI